LPLGVTGQVRDVGADLVQAHAAGRQGHAAEALGPLGRRTPNRDVEGGALEMRDRDGAGGLGPVGGAPAPGEPVRRVVGQRIARLGQDFGALAHDPAQDRVHEAGQVLELRIGLGETDPEIDRRVIGHVEVEDLHGAGRQQRHEARLILGQPLRHPRGEHPAQEAEAPEGGGGDGAGEARIGGIEPGGAARLGKRILEGEAAGLADEVGHRALRDLPRREPRDGAVDRRRWRIRVAAYRHECHFLKMGPFATGRVPLPFHPTHRDASHDESRADGKPRRRDPAAARQA
jgi:hypothetical protein